MFLFCVNKDNNNEENFVLKAYEGPLNGQQITLFHQSTTIGRHEDNDVRINDPKISRHHARIDIFNDCVYLADLKSTAGTYVNGKRISREIIKDGDLLQFNPPAENKEKAPPIPHIIDKKIPVFVPGNPTEFLNKDKNRWVSSLKLGDTEKDIRDRKKLEILLSVSAALSKPEKIEVKIGDILSLLFELMDIDRAAIWVLDKALEYSKNIDKNIHPEFSYKAFHKKDEIADDNPPVLSMTIINKVLEEGEGKLIKDALVDEKFKEARSVKLQGIRTCVCVPLKTEKHLLGVLYADSSRAVDKFTEEDLKFVSSFASQAAIAIENSLLYEKIANETRIRSRFERFFPPNAINEVIKKPETIGKGGEERLVTVLFSDIRNYTALSRTKAPRDIANMLNEYFPPMVKIVFNRNGTLEKYIGDALMAIWGAPILSEDHILNSVMAAIDMQKAIAELNNKWNLSNSGNTIEIGIGINTGNAFVGNIGDESYLQYAAIGDTTNLASRLCSSAAPGEIILSEVSYNALKDSHINFEEIPEAELKGFEKKLKRYRVIYK